MDLNALLTNPYFKGAAAGFAAAVVIDLVEFRKWKSYQEAIQYDWGVAAWRWFQGTVTGLVTAFGINLGV